MAQRRPQPARDRGPIEEREPLHPGLEPRPDEPATPTDVDLDLLSRGVKAELRGLSSERAEKVAAHLAAAAELVDVDPALAYAHAEAARRRAARLPVVREAAATTAYAAGEYAAALNEFRALRRMTGSDDFLAVMADCERGLGRPQAALKLIREGLATQPPIAARVELKLVEAGARDALGQRDEAVRLLRQEIEAVGPRGPKAARARLRYYFAELLAGSGDEAGAEQWFGAALRLDPDNETGAAEALAALQGVTIEFDETEDAAEPAAAEDGGTTSVGEPQPAVATQEEPGEGQ
ncbi:tetratricopeptide repeat protein [Micropruina sonneratiae]|uniref:tetratricopeptide repeat protein n=1 Tax=Micropruina sonneratiae TaxID=2986940 RepID=UPI002227A846|nr:tetratricopeptide repeat protein [Micropruina sp. KQZ13P-5]MCW3157977.1 tetratricopeptide repeat protein [Micropruina sp. KQZ13P-5]